ncbi:uncharacterized protein LOC109533843 isoform X2 [Dendroctonus ponderosae]|uniref:Uncharacterized protein n=2 Tax=Dendroctonus ponderosae TaxID=77166 RepID=A0AAR5P1Y2_DENPD|nr:uncharacterized protein LOC109533843 isoform X2 [Dendroctonus ponderosae]KAH1029419.1 hypothetical protein HUJ05_002666 [Dendroctonus ponderosae]
MFGSKLRAWMEAVRPKKKQHRKEKQGKNAPPTNNRPNTSTSTHTVTWKNSCLLDSERKDVNREPQNSSSDKTKEKHNGVEAQVSRYSANNLSSPESAYSTGYSTDGTSPGGAPPNYSITDKKLTESSLKTRLNPELNKQAPSSSKVIYQNPADQAPALSSVSIQGKLIDRPSLEEKAPCSNAAASSTLFGKLPEPSGLVSPRQRNRIRTNPWLPGGSASTVASPIPARQEVKGTPIGFRKSRNSPIQYRYLSPALQRRSLSSSSCSSISAGPNHSFEHRVPKSLSDEDDCTLNEMMGKYDESYIYEKETDILSDSDPTDCESDIDTGQDGGDEEDNGEEELDFIDNGSYVEIESKADNTGHCMYIIPPDMQRKRSSRRRATRRGKEVTDRRRKLASSKKNCKQLLEKNRHSSFHQDGSKSAGATPISIRKSNPESNQPKSQSDSLKKRSNSVCLQRDVNVLIEKRDREADMKYQELIGQAEQIIRTMNINGLSPRRLPGPTNKRVELLRTTECAKPEVLFMGKPNEEPSIPCSNISPSTIIFKNTRFSPKKNHITNFIINNSPVLVRKEMQSQSPISVRRTLTDYGHYSPLVIRKEANQLSEDVYKHSQMLGNNPTVPVNVPSKPTKEHHEVTFGFPISSRKSHKVKSILHKNDPASILSSPRHRRETECPIASSSSEDESLQKYKKKLSKSCPQSEPMRRKVYFGRNTINITKCHGKTVAFNLSKHVPNGAFEEKVLSSENLRHQVLLNTIQSLKRNLEDHSASLQQTYRSTQNVYKY